MMHPFVKTAQFEIDLLIGTCGLATPQTNYLMFMIETCTDSCQEDIFGISSPASPCLPA
jgi:hypothetical protein